jgi:sugar phosphate isomerase/epimerase
MPFGLPGEPRYEMSADRRLYRETKAALAETGVRLLDIELVRIAEGHDPRDFLPALESGASLGAGHVLTSIWTPERSFAIDSFAALCELARPLRLKVNLEFVAWSCCSTLSAAIDVVRAAACSNAGLMIDTFHFHHSGDLVDALDSIPRNWFSYAHVSDDAAPVSDSLEDCKRRGREERLFPGEGIIDISGILDHLPDTVVCAIELPHHRRVVELGAAGFARRCLERTKRYLGIALSESRSNARMADSADAGPRGRSERW